MIAWRQRLGSIGDIVTFDYAYMKEGRRRPDRQPALVAAHREALESARAAHPGPVVLIGKSMGSRMGCHLSLETPVQALVCLGYPLIGQNGARRDEVLVALTTPVLFVQGTRDTLCPLGDLADVRRRMRAANELHVVEGGDHSLELLPGRRKREPDAQEQANAGVLAAIAGFVDSQARL
jgi:uncharacterized protein